MFSYGSMTASELNCYSAGFWVGDELKNGTGTVPEESSVLSEPFPGKSQPGIRVKPCRIAAL